MSAFRSDKKRKRDVYPVRFLLNIDSCRESVNWLGKDPHLRREQNSNKWNHFSEAITMKNYSVPAQVPPEPACCAVAHERTFCKMLQLGLNSGASPVASRFCAYQGIFAKTQNSDLSRKQQFIALTRSGSVTSVHGGLHCIVLFTIFCGLQRRRARLCTNSFVPLWNSACCISKNKLYSLANWTVTL